MTVSEESITVVKATVPALRQYGNDIVLKFYQTLFTRYPQVRENFNFDNQEGGTSTEEYPRQVARLAHAILAYASNIGNVAMLVPVVKKICERHVAHDVQPPQYEAVGECLLAAIAAVLGDAATPEILNAWKEAYAFLAELFVDTEKGIKTGHQDKAGFTGMVDMRVEESSPDGSDGFYIRIVPVGHEVPPIVAGQFVGVKFGDEGKQQTVSLMLVCDPEEVTAKSLKMHVPQREKNACRVLGVVPTGTLLTVSPPCGP